ncbi:MarR family winged helix-turn-helix transcriptional regulator [Actinoplanes sp. NPDC049265]|uniref:MarR family winged helix-turn-helix transcriptional regulator n=1 Tax=Actinoplanes sp. NPDC049265 TaxID=3363902 RepID=UPI003720EEA7
MLLILAAQREGNRLYGQALRPLGVTPSQAEVLSLLRERQPLTLTGLGRLLVCESNSNPSRLVDRLIGLGLVDRRVPEHDRRQTELSLTDHGEQVAGEIVHLEQSFLATVDEAAQGHDVDQITGFLRTFVADLPSGRAIARRAASTV